VSWRGLAALLLAVSLGSACSRSTTPATPVILVGLDGFGWDFMEAAETPNLDALVARGVRAEWLVPIFPTKTFPNHYSIVTGLHAERHGIVSNTMYDPVFARRFSLGDREAVQDGRWWEGEPIWVTAERAGLTTAAFFWPGTEADIQGIRPTHWRPYAHRTPHNERVDQVLGWLDLPDEERPALIATYFADVDETAHTFGVNAPETMAAIREADRAIGRLVRGLEQRGLDGRVNLVLVSDHGMAPRSRDRVIFLDDFIDLADVEVIDWSPVAAIRPHAGREDEVYKGLRGAHPNLQVYRKEEIPERWRYRNHRRIQPILAVADEGWVISSHEYFATHQDAYRGATHGYDNTARSMQATFVAVGPAFREGVVVPPFQNIHIYALLCHLLGIEPAPNDGSLDSVRMVLGEEARRAR
jgi:predicted AlkP superfamily pyrophosphatase or phosphodiesterase